MVFVIGKQRVFYEVKTKVLCVICVSDFRYLNVTEDCRYGESAGG
jgi:hypothetical protein